jgi:hypothetical protein
MGSSAFVQSVRDAEFGFACRNGLGFEFERPLREAEGGNQVGERAGVVVRPAHPSTPRFPSQRAGARVSFEVVARNGSMNPG